MNYLALCAIAKNERPEYLREWITYHLLAGAEHFILFDNDSRIPLRKTLAPFVSKGLATVVDMPGLFRQLPAYAHCLAEYGKAFRFIGFLDLDEFLLPRETDDVRLLLGEYEADAGLAVNWAMFGSGGHVQRPRGFQVEHYRQRFDLSLPVNQHVKCLVDPARTLAPLSPHHFQHREGTHCVTEAGIPVFGPRAPHSSRRMRINHYYFRSQQDFAEKIERGFAQPVKNRAGYVWEEFFRQLGLAVVLDVEAHKYLEKMKRLGRTSFSLAAAREFAPKQQATLDGIMDEAFAHLGRGEVARAEKTLALAACHHPENPAIKLALAGFYRLTGKPERAMDFVRRSLGLQATPEAYHELLLLYRQAGAAEEARNLEGFLRTSLEREGLLTPQWQARLDAPWEEKRDATGAPLSPVLPPGSPARRHPS